MLFFFDKIDLRNDSSLFTYKDYKDFRNTIKCNYSRTSIARTPLVPGKKIVRDRGSSSQ